MENLKPCPFCGGSAYGESFGVRKGFEANVQCSECLLNMQTITYDTEQEAKDAALEAWNKRTESKWISVKDRLPEELKAVIVFGLCDNEYRKQMEIGWLFQERWITSYVGGITHWMTIPEPPSGWTRDK